MAAADEPDAGEDDVGAVALAALSPPSRRPGEDVEGVAVETATASSGRRWSRSSHATLPMPVKSLWSKFRRMDAGWWRRSSVAGVDHDRVRSSGSGRPKADGERLDPPGGRLVQFAAAREAERVEDGTDEDAAHHVGPRWRRDAHRRLVRDGRLLREIEGAVGVELDDLRCKPRTSSSRECCARKARCRRR